MQLCSAQECRERQSGKFAYMRASIFKGMTLTKLGGGAWGREGTPSSGGYAAVQCTRVQGATERQICCRIAAPPYATGAHTCHQEAASHVPHTGQPRGSSLSRLAQQSRAKPIHPHTHFKSSTLMASVDKSEKKTRAA